MPVVTMHKPFSEHPTSGKAFERPGTVNFSASASPSSQGFASPPNIVMTKTFGAIAGSAATAGGGARTRRSAEARREGRANMTGSHFSGLIGERGRTRPSRRGDRGRSL
jgi:hypothetical protein